jgi:DNA-binding CsgD family transcriptional regulator
MTQGYHALTDKEKQALRLLTSGYDAKSMAQHLGLSVHTVNERLRDARRKMATSSSREAARQLREIEGPATENLGDKSFGDAEQTSDAAQPLYQPERHRMWNVPGWKSGGIAMSIAAVVLALATLSVPETAVSTTPSTAAAADETAAVTASARQWLTMLDADDWDGTWNATGQSFKALNTSAIWTDVSKTVRERFGHIKSRELASTDFVPAPPAGLWVLKFRAHYANQANAIETISLMRENDSWRVVGVYVE